jgi:hypothetical protein
MFVSRTPCWSLPSNRLYFSSNYSMVIPITISDLCLSDWQSLETAFQLTNMLNHIAPANSTAGTAWVKRLHIDLDTKV